ncbi:hypothetical protein ADL27_48875, partial [Streptomyces sp. NRRL F-6602]
AYVSHDDGHYQHVTPFNRVPEEGTLRPAFRLWAQVVSRPSPDQAFVNAGKRDAALLVLGYYTRGRASELVRYRVADAVFVTAGLLVMTKRVSKNDKNSEGREYEIDDPDAIAA